jgi:isocitrate dehydrogenase
MAVIPDRSYAGVYAAAIENCKKYGSLDPRTMGTVQNIGLMAQAAEEYGSHNKTFVAQKKGAIRAVDANGEVLLSQSVEKGDIFRMCQTKPAPLQNWAELAVSHAKMFGLPVVFWLDPARAHDREVRKAVDEALSKIDANGAEILFMDPSEATDYTMQRMRDGKDTIGATGNVLRDYLTDLFPILEVGTSAKMLSVVPLMDGGGLFETGAGGSAPKQVEQFLAEGYLRWDSLGEYFALVESFAQYARTNQAPQAQILADALDAANGQILEHNRVPLRKLGELDNRGSHFYLALYWAQELKQRLPEIPEFAELAQALAQNETKIVNELAAAQGKPVDLGGYYLPDAEKLDQAMRPSRTLREIFR